MNPKHVDVRAYDSYLIEPDEDGIITIGVWDWYRLRLHMEGFAQQARVADFKHHIVFLQRIIARDVLNDYLIEWMVFLTRTDWVDLQKSRRLLKVLTDFAEKYKEAGND